MFFLLIILGVQDKDSRIYMSSWLSFSCMLHDIWMKIAASCTQKGWKFPMLVIDCLPYLALMHSCLAIPRVLVPFC